MSTFLLSLAPIAVLTLLVWLACYRIHSRRTARQARIVAAGSPRVTVTMRYPR